MAAGLQTGSIYPLFRMRALIILLALLLPLQLSWAAMAPYCQAGHERSSAHPGHHEHHEHHEHRALTPPVSASLGAGKPVNAEGNCSLCDFACMKQMQADSLLVSPAASVCLKPRAPHVTAPASHIADGPDKPNWSLAA